MERVSIEFPEFRKPGRLPVRKSLPGSVHLTRFFCKLLCHQLPLRASISYARQRAARRRFTIFTQARIDLQGRRFRPWSACRKILVGLGVE